MKFGSEFGTIIGDATCPRCNAAAELRALQDHLERVVVRVVCGKCRSTAFAGLTTARAVHLQRVRGRLEKALAATKDPSVKARVRRKLAEIDHNESLAALFIG